MLRISNKYSVKIAGFTLIFILLLAEGVTIFNTLPKTANGLSTEFLFMNPPKQNSYSFKAKGKSYLVANINRTDFTWVSIDDDISIELSYGLNIIPLKFSANFETHILYLEDHTYFDYVVIEPQSLDKGFVESTLIQTQLISFKAGGPISVLLKPEFSYNLLYLEFDEHLIKKTYDTSIYPEINSQIYSYFIEDGKYIRFDMNVNPGDHFIELKGNGTIEYQIVVNSDWDEDNLPDVFEIQKKDFIDLDPTTVDTWGFFEKSRPSILLNTSNENEYEVKSGHFTFYIPQEENHLLMIHVEVGEFFNFVFDGDDLTMRNITLIGESSQSNYLVALSGGGWHYIRYQYYSNYNKINFMVDGENVKVVDFYELYDSDGDGVKDAQESTNQLNFNDADNDNDGLPDNYDASPSSSLILHHNKICQIVVPTDINKNSIISLQIKKPTNDYSTNGIPRLWNDILNVSIFPVLRLFGSIYQEDEDSAVLPLTVSELNRLWGKSVDTYNIVSDSYNHEGAGDPLPLEEDGELHFIFPYYAEETLEYEFKIPKDTPGKEDGILDIRFDIIWLVTNYENGKIRIIHYYNFEEDVIIQSFSNKEIANVDYLLATPDSHIESKILWNLIQNPKLGTPSKFNVDDDIIGWGNCDYLKIANSTMTALKSYYESNTNLQPQAEVSYFAGSYASIDVLYKISILQEHGLNYSLMDLRDYEAFFSFYSINNVYEDQNYSIVDEEVLGESIIPYMLSKSIYNPDQIVATIFELPLQMRRNSYGDSEILDVIYCLSEPIPSDEIPFSHDEINSDKIILRKDTIIESYKFEQIPTVNFDNDADILKQYFDNRIFEIEQGRLFFEESSGSPPTVDLLLSYLDDLKVNLKKAHKIYNYFNSESGNIYYPGENWDIYREFDNFLNYYIDKNGDFLVELLGYAADAKLNALYNLDLKLEEMLEQQREIYIEIRIPEQEDPNSDSFTIINKRLTKSLCDTSETIRSARIRTINTKQQIIAQTDKGGKKGYYSQRLKFCITINVISAGAQLYYGFLGIKTSLVELMKIFNQIYNGSFQENTVEFSARVIIGICSLVISTISFIEGLITIYELIKFGENAGLQSTKNFCCKLGYVLAIIILVVEWGVFLDQIFSGGLTGQEFEIQLTKMIVESTIVIVSLALSIAWPGVGTVIGLGITIASAVTGFLLPNEPSLDVDYANIYFSDDTLLNIRRHGSFEIGDLIRFEHRIINDGKNNGWIRTRFKIEGDDWESNWDGWKERGDWDDHEWPWDAGFPRDGGTFTRNFDRKITKPSSKIKYRFQLDFDWERYEFPLFYRMKGARVRESEVIDIPALQTSISSFYADTTELKTTELLKEKFLEAVNNYQYYDAYNIATEVIDMLGEEAEISYDHFRRIDRRKQGHLWFYLYKTRNSEEFIDLIFNFYDDGFKALNPLDFWFLTDFYLNLLAYENSDGYVIFPEEWYTKKKRALKDAYLFDELRHDLPFKININSGLKGAVIDIDPITKRVDLDFKLNLYGSSDNPIVEILLTPPDNFTITPNHISQPLASNIQFNITQDDPNLIMGVYFIEMIINRGDELIYSELIPIRIMGYSFLDFQVDTPEIVNPGEIWNILTIINQGTLPENVKFIIEGVPEDFIYKDFNPNDFVDSVQYFTIDPGEIRKSFAINPPKIYSTCPGIYNYTVSAINLIDNSTFFVYEGSFEIAEFYDIKIDCLNLQKEIFDFQIANYEISISNLGNVPELVEIYLDNINFADVFIEADKFNLNPGETKSFTVSIDPFDLGSQQFKISFSTEHATEDILASITVIDDDISPPLLENITVFDDLESIIVNFTAYDKVEGDDLGLSMISIFIDNELICTYSTEQSLTFFNLCLKNKWVWQLGTHYLYFEITDADDDRINDELNNAFYAEFETTLEEMYDYVIFLINNLIKIITENTPWFFRCTIIKKLSQVRNEVIKAYEFLETNSVHKCVVELDYAKFIIQTLECLFQSKRHIKCFDKNNLTYILSSLQDIRNKIVELKGCSIDNDDAYQLSLIEIDVLKLQDLIVINYSMYLKGIKNLPKMIEWEISFAILKIILDREYKWLLKFALCNIYRAEKKIVRFLEKGKVSETLANSILNELAQIKEKLEEIIN